MKVVMKIDSYRYPLRQDIGKEGVGERGRNRTFNLLIKSQLLCQLSYAPAAYGKVGTISDYIIRVAPSCQRERQEIDAVITPSQQAPLQSS